MLLNDWFIASVKEDNFVIIRPPFFVYNAQAAFPPSKILNEIV